MTVTKVVLEEEPEEVEEPSDVSIDLGLLCVSDPTPITDATPKALNAIVRDNTQKLIDSLMKQPIIKTDKSEKLRGIIYELPEVTTQFPREKPKPRPKPLTKWEKFKKVRGINTRKKDKIVYDEVSGEWKRRFGYDRANDPLQVPIIEAPGNWQEGDPDPFTVLRDEKKTRVAHNKEKHQRNLIEATGFRAPGTIHLPSAIDYSSKKEASVKKPVKRDPLAHVKLALRIAQHSTRSMGKHDPLLRGEEVPTMKAEKAREQLSSKGERERNLDVLNVVVGKTTKKKAIFHKEQAARIEKQKLEGRRHQRNKAIGGRGKKRPGMTVGASPHQKAHKKAKRSNK